MKPSRGGYEEQTFNTAAIARWLWEEEADHRVRLEAAARWLREWRGVGVEPMKAIARWLWRQGLDHGAELPQGGYEETTSRRTIQLSQGGYAESMLELLKGGYAESQSHVSFWWEAAIARWLRG